MGGRGGCERRIEFFVKIQKQNIWGGGGGSGGGWGAQGGCERRIEVFVKIQNNFFFGGGGSGGWVGGWVGGGVGGSGWGGVRVDVSEELKFLGKFTKKKSGWGVGSEGVRWGVELVGGQGGCERNVRGRG